MTEIEQAIDVLENGIVEGDGYDWRQVQSACELAIAALRRTAEDDKAREEGLLVVLPCKVGDEVFFNLWNIKSQKYETLPGTIKNARYDAIDGSVMVSNGEYFRVLGRDAFLTRAEAEAALGGGGDG